MKRRPLLRRFLDKLKGNAEPTPPPVAEEKPREEKKKKNTGSSFESLENRIAPAILVNATTVTYKDLDGDLVTVKFSKPVFTGSADQALLTALTMFTFKDEGGGTTRISGNNNTGEQLQLLDIDGIVTPGANNPVSGASITITAKKQNGVGDDLTNVGYIRASSNAIFGVSLGAVTVDGDLGQIDAGDPNASVAVKSLTVQSMGAAGLSSQDATGNLESTFTGALKKLVVKGSIIDAVLETVKGLTAKSVGKIGGISIGGALTASAGNSVDGAGSITSETSIGAVKIGTIFGGKGNESGRIAAGTTIGNIAISGEIRGGEGENSGEITAAKSIGNVQLSGNLWAGIGDNSGRIESMADIGAITLQNLHGSETADGDPSGEDSAIISAAGRIKSLTVRDSILGGEADRSGSVSAGGSIGSLTVGGSLMGGDGEGSGQVSAAQIGNVTIGRRIEGGEGDESGSIVSRSSIGNISVKNGLNMPIAILAGKGDASGAITADRGIGAIMISGGIDATIAGAGSDSASIQAGGAIASLKVGGSILGGAGSLSGSIATDGTFGAVKISGSVTGGGGVGSGSIISSGKIASLTVSGSLSGGGGGDSGSIIAGSDPSVSGDVGHLSITGGMTGGAGLSSGSIRVGGKIVNLTIGANAAVPAIAIAGGTGGGSGSIFSATGISNAAINGSVMGGGGLNSASIFAEGTISKLSIAGDVQGGAGNNSASIRALDRFTDTGIAAGTLGRITVGDVIGGDGVGSAQVFADGSLTSLVAASIEGGSGNDSASIRVGQGQAALDNDFASIGRAQTITVRGGIASGTGDGSAAIETGGSLATLTVGGDIAGTAVKVGRDLGSATISGAVSDSSFSAFGSTRPNANSDVAIGSITVNGNVSGSVFLAGYDRFGNAANGNAQVGAFKIVGNWVASSLAAGVEDVDGDGFGSADDAPVGGGTISRIASIVITGSVTGTAAEGDHFGFVARTIGKATISGATLALTAAGDIIPLAGSPATNDTTLREIS